MRVVRGGVELGECGGWLKVRALVSGGLRVWTLGVVSVGIGGRDSSAAHGGQGMQPSGRRDMVPDHPTTATARGRA